MRTALSSKRAFGILLGTFAGAIGLPLCIVLFMRGSGSFVPRISWLNFFLLKLLSDIGIVGAILGGLTACLYLNYYSPTSSLSQDKQAASLCCSGGLIVAGHAVWEPAHSLYSNLLFLHSQRVHFAHRDDLLIFMQWLSSLILNLPFMWAMLLVAASLRHRRRQGYNQQPTTAN